MKKTVILDVLWFLPRQTAVRVFFGNPHRLRSEKRLPEDSVNAELGKSRHAQFEMWWNHALWAALFT